MKTVHFEGIRQAARILSCVQPYLKKSEDVWVDDIKNSLIRNYKRTGGFVDCISCSGYFLNRIEDMGGSIVYEVFVSSVMIDQFVLNDFQANPYSYDDINYYETIVV